MNSIHANRIRWVLLAGLATLFLWQGSASGQDKARLSDSV